MNIPAINSLNILSGIPSSLRKELIDTFNNIEINYRQNRWEPSELNGGKFCEIVYTILKGYIDGSYPSTSSKPSNFVDACRALEISPPSFPRSIRIQIPRMITALYEIRNNRGVGHSGGDVNPNHMDSVCVLFMCKWIMAELIRVFHGLDTKTAESIIDELVERILPIVWNVDGKFRILDTSIKMKGKTLLLLYQRKSPVFDDDLFQWTEHSNKSHFRDDVLRSLHHDKLIEYNEKTKQVFLSPKGIAYTEKNILPKILLNME
jgi:hypothetical protein